MPAKKTSGSKTKKRAGKTAAGTEKRGVTKASIRRLARRGGCKRIGREVYDEARFILKSFVDTVTADVAALLELTDRKTVRAVDVLFALKKQGRTLYAVA